MKTTSIRSSFITWLVFLFCIASGYGATFNLTDVSGLATAGTTTGDIAVVAGYHTSGDGGGGTFILDTSPPSATVDGGLVFNGPSGGKWFRQVPNGSLNVKMFGAKSGEGVSANDAILNTDYIQKALDGAANNGHEVLHFLGGYYKLGRTVVPESAAVDAELVFGEGSPTSKHFAHVDGETPAIVYYYLRMGAHQNPIRPNLRLAGEGATLEGITATKGSKGHAILLIRTKFTSVEVDGFTFRTNTLIAGGGGAVDAGYRRGISIVPMQAPTTDFYATNYFTDPLPITETQAMRDAPTESITISNSKFIGCRSAVEANFLPRRDFLTYAGNLNALHIRKCDFLYPNGSDLTAIDWSPTVALWVGPWVGTLNVSDSLFDGATTGDATSQGPTGNNRGPVDNFIMNAALHSVIERNVIRHAGVEALSFPRSQELPLLQASENASVSVDASKGLELKIARNDGPQGPLTLPNDPPLSLREQLVGVRVVLARVITGSDSLCEEYGEYFISEILSEVHLGATLWTRLKLSSTGDPKNAAANTTLALNNLGWRLYLAPSEMVLRGLERTAIVRDNHFAGAPSFITGSAVWWYTSPAIRADDYRLTVTGNIFDRCRYGVTLIGHSFADEAVAGSLVDRNTFELVDYEGDSHLPQEPQWFASGVLVMAPGVKVTNNTFHSATNKRAYPVYAVQNAGGVFVVGNTMTADRKLEGLVGDVRGYAVALNNSGGVFTSDLPAFVANNNFRNIDGILTQLSPVYTAFGNSTGSGVPEFSISGNFHSVHSSNLSLAGGNAAAPSFNFGANGDSNTGIFQPDVDSVGISLDGTLVAKFKQGTYTPSGGSPTEYNALQMTAGTEDRPGYGFIIDEDTGMYHKAEDQIGFATGGDERVAIQNSGLLIGQGTPLKMVKAVSASAVFSAINAGATGTTGDIAVAGAEVGDVVILQWTGTDLPAPKYILTGYVNSAGNVRIRAVNTGTGNQSAATYPVRIVLLQFGS
jgi:hypothetical protein